MKSLLLMISMREARKLDLTFLPKFLFFPERPHYHLFAG